MKQKNCMLIPEVTVANYAPVFIRLMIGWPQIKLLPATEFKVDLRVNMTKRNVESIGCIGESLKTD